MLGYVVAAERIAAEVVARVVETSLVTMEVAVPEGTKLVDMAGRTFARLAHGTESGSRRRSRR